MVLVVEVKIHSGETSGWVGQGDARQAPSDLTPVFPSKRLLTGRMFMKHQLQTNTSGGNLPTQ